MGISGERTVRLVLAGLGLGCFALLLTLELVTESDDLEWPDVLVDALGILLLIGSSVGVALLAQRMQSQHEEKLTLMRDLQTARAEGNGWRSKVRSHLVGLKEGMDQQFEAWGMTTAEREVGLLMLKGLSHKEIAGLRATTEATVRQQAQSIYRKAKLPGKTAFSAYFLEDLFSPEAGPCAPVAVSPEPLVASTAPVPPEPAVRPVAPTPPRRAVPSRPAIDGQEAPAT